VTRHRNILIWLGFAVVVLALISYIPFFAVFPLTRDVPWANYLLFVIGLALLGFGLSRASSISRSNFQPQKPRSTAARKRQHSCCRTRPGRKSHLSIC
jgi:hypothetical protein